MKSFPRNLLYLGLLILLTACAEDKEALDTWLHADTGSYGAEISPNGRYLLTGEISGFARVWDLEENRVKYSLQHDEGEESGTIGGSFSSQGDVLVTVEQNSLARWSTGTGRLTGYWKWPNLTDVAVSSNGRYALIGSKDNQAIYFDMVEGQMVYAFPHRDVVNSVALSKDGRFAITGSDDFIASLWRLSDGERIWSKNMEWKVGFVELSDDGQFALANAFIGDAHIYRTNEAGDLVSRLDEVRMTIVSADFSDNGQLLATGRAAKSIDIWDVNTGTKRETWQPKVRHFRPDAATILALRLDTNATTLISESSTGIGQRWALNQ